MKASPHAHHAHLVFKILLEITKLCLPNLLSLPLKSQSLFSPWTVTTTKPNIYFFFASFTLQLSVTFPFLEVLSLQENLYNFWGGVEVGRGFAGIWKTKLMSTNL